MINNALDLIQNLLANWQLVCFAGGATAACIAFVKNLLQSRLITLQITEMKQKIQENAERAQQRAEEVAARRMAEEEAVAKRKEMKGAEKGDGSMAASKDEQMTVTGDKQMPASQPMRRTEKLYPISVPSELDQLRLERRDRTLRSVGYAVLAIAFLIATATFY